MDHTHTNLSLTALTNECLNADVDVDKIVASFGVDVVGSGCCCFFFVCRSLSLSIVEIRWIVIDSKIAAAVFCRYVRLVNNVLPLLLVLVLELLLELRAMKCQCDYFIYTGGCSLFISQFDLCLSEGANIKCQTEKRIWMCDRDQ